MKYVFYDRLKLRSFTESVLRVQLGKAAGLVLPGLSHLPGPEACSSAAWTAPGPAL